MVDVRLRFGLEDQAVRMPKKDWGTFIDSWVINGEDVVLRSSYKRHETNIVMRGTYHAIYTVAPADADKQIPVYHCFAISDVRKRILAEQGMG